MLVFTVGTRQVLGHLFLVFQNSARHTSLVVTVVDVTIISTGFVICLTSIYQLLLRLRFRSFMMLHSSCCRLSEPAEATPLECEVLTYETVLCSHKQTSVGTTFLATTTRTLERRSWGAKRQPAGSGLVLVVVQDIGVLAISFRVRLRVSVR